MNKEKGQATILVIIFLLIAGVFLLQIPARSTEQQQLSDPACRPTHLNSNGTIKADAPEIQAPSYTHEKNSPTALFPTLNQDTHPYKLVKSGVAMLDFHVKNHFSSQDLRSAESNILTHPEVLRGSDNESHHHFSQWVHPAVVPSPTNPSGAEKYAVLYPASYSFSPGYSAGFLSEEGSAEPIFFADYQIIFLAHLQSNGELYEFEGTDKNGKKVKFALVDLYQRVKPENHTQPATAVLPASVLKCKNNTQALGQGTLIEKTNRGSQDNNQLQLQTFIPKSFNIEADWYYPSCKPAIYLYPEKKQSITVSVETKGELTYTDPSYPTGGWKVDAYPDGVIVSNNKLYPYLYYESRIKDVDIEKPSKGYVIEYEKLPGLYSEILPKLGLNAKETKEFKEYWEKALPKAPFYFVGIMTEESIDNIEPLTISPKPQTIIRVRTYFEALNEKKVVEEPSFDIGNRQGFVVAEWGGIVKLHPGTEFSCSL